MSDFRRHMRIYEACSSFIFALFLKSSIICELSSPPMNIPESKDALTSHKYAYGRKIRDESETPKNGPLNPADSEEIYQLREQAKQMAQLSVALPEEPKPIPEYLRIGTGVN